MFAIVITSSSKAVDRLLTAHVSTRIAERLPSISGLSQIALLVSNLEHFEIACAELERKVTSIR
jgi:exocyst complex component 6